MEIPPELYWSQPGRFPHPDWERIASQIETTDKKDVLHTAWCRVASRWMEHFAVTLGATYRVYESANFIVVTCSGAPKAREVLTFLEHCHAEILRSLPFIDVGELYGKCVAIIFANEEDFYEYFSGFCPDDGEHAAVGGVFLNRGYGHFILPSEDLGVYRAVMCHELCHSLLSAFPLPNWLNEAITCEIEHKIVGSNPYQLDRETVRDQQSYWTPEFIQSFWTGESFGFPDEGQRLSYQLARFLFNALASYSTPASMASFIRSAHWEDSGCSAAMETFGVDPAEILDGLLGEENWQFKGWPKPTDFVG